MHSQVERGGAGTCAPDPRSTAPGAGWNEATCVSLGLKTIVTSDEKELLVEIKEDSVFWMREFSMVLQDKKR